MNAHHLPTSICYLLLCVCVWNHSPLQAQPEVDVPRGLYKKPVKVSIRHEMSEAQLWYTLDGSDPTLGHAFLYEKPLKIRENTVLRVQAFLGESPLGVSVTHTYLFPMQVLTQPEVPEGWEIREVPTHYKGFPVRADMAMDPRVLEDPAYEKEAEQGFWDIPTVALAMAQQDFWDLTLTNERRIISVELLFPDAPDENVQANCEADGTSHKLLKRSFKLAFKKEYGAGKLESKALFRKFSPLPDPEAEDDFDRLILRGGTQRSWARRWYPDRTAFTRDQWYRESQLAMSGLGVHGTFVHLFVNGVYMGLYNLTERPDEHFFSSYYKGKDEDWFVYNHDGIVSGDETRFYFLEDSLLSRDLSRAAEYKQFTQYVDVPLYCDYLILTWMCGMADWPDNNYYCAYQAKDAGALFFVGWDAEVSWDDNDGGHPGAWVHGDFLPEASGYSIIPEIWHAAVRQPDFLMTFADRVFQHTQPGGAMTDQAQRQRWQALNAYIYRSVILESARWGDALEDSVLRTRDGSWKKEVARVDSMMQGNVARFIRALQDAGYYPEVPGLRWEGGESWSLHSLAPMDEGSIYYRVDGGDPRLPGGSLAPQAQTYDSPVDQSFSLPLKARMKVGESWGPLLVVEPGATGTGR